MLAKIKNILLITTEKDIEKYQHLLVMVVDWELTSITKFKMSQGYVKLLIARSLLVIAVYV